MNKSGLFIGLLTLDFIYLSSEIPQSNQKLVALDYTVAAGGPATNAAVTFSYLGNQAILLAPLGNHPIKSLILADLEKQGVILKDLEPNRLDSPPVSSIIVTPALADETEAKRAVISINASKAQNTDYPLTETFLQDIQVILIDGHQLPISLEIAQLAQSSDIPVVLDGGSWKPGLERILPQIDYAICSADFHPPNCHNFEDIFAYLTQIGISHIAITNGQNPIQYLSLGERGEIPVSQVSSVDTLGAGDIFHGAFCQAILEQDFRNSLSFAAEIASKSCQFFGTRLWIMNNR